MLKQMKKTIGILLAVCFLISVTAATVSAGHNVVKEKKIAAGVDAGPVMVKEKKTAIIILKDVKTTIYKWSHHRHHHHHHKLYHHQPKSMKTIKALMDS
jgi:hypothetical protein